MGQLVGQARHLRLMVTTPSGTGRPEIEVPVTMLTPPTAPPAPPAPAVIVIDNDDANAASEVQETYKWQEVPDSPGSTKITTGATFPVRVVSELTSKTAKAGDPVEGVVRVDLKIGGRMVAPKGTRVVGHVFNVMPARRLLVAELSRRRWWRANGEIGVQFDEIVTSDGEHIPLDATPAKQPRIVINKSEGRIMGVNDKGEVASPLSIQLKEQAIHLAIRGAASAGRSVLDGGCAGSICGCGGDEPVFCALCTRLERTSPIDVSRGCRHGLS